MRSFCTWVAFLLVTATVLAPPAVEAQTRTTVKKKKRTKPKPPPPPAEEEEPVAEPAPEPEPPPTRRDSYLSSPEEEPSYSRPPPPEAEPAERPRRRSTYRPTGPRPAAGFVFRLEPGIMMWNLDRARLESQMAAEATNVDPLLIQQTPSAFGLLAHLGYNILGHATIGMDLSGTGWDLFNDARGGAGFIAGTVAWHPLALLEALDLLEAEIWRKLEISFSFGLGYGVVGEQRALDGFHTELGTRLEFFLSETVSVGVALRLYNLGFGRYVLNWSQNNFVSLPQGSGGSAFMPTLILGFHPG